VGVPVSARPAGMVAVNFRAVAKNTLRGFFDLHLASGLVVHECSLHQKADGARWIGLPSRPQVDGSGTVRRDQAGKTLYTPILEIPDAGRRKAFRDQALRAVDALLGVSSQTEPRREQAKPDERELNDSVDDLYRDGGAP
jgi:hypothetical protein